MARERYKKQRAGSFFGGWIYDRVVPQDHFLRRLQEIVPWGRFTDQLVHCYAGARWTADLPMTPP
jgi:hypothetical protein